MKWRAIACAAMVLGLASCGDDLHGVVTAKDVQPGYAWTYMQPINTTACSGNPTVCSTRTTGFLPIFFWVPTCYRIVVEGSTSGDTCLDETKWQEIEVGDDYLGPDVDPKDRKQKRGEGEPE